MRAVRLERDGVALVDLPTPEPEEGEVLVRFELPCGRCRSCLRKRTNLCTEGATLGFTVPGGYAEFVCVPQDVVLAAPAHLELAHAAVLPCSGATAHHAGVT